MRRFRGRWRAAVGMLLVLLLAGPSVLVVAFRFVPPPVTPLMLIRRAEGYPMHRQWVGYDRIAPTLAESVIAAEDNLFCGETLGFDFKTLGGQIDAWRAGERPRGASTITTQTAKNLMLWPGRDPVRKVAEAWLTPQIALLWPKQRVLETYLNIVEFGPGIYGAQAAARAYFGKRAADLSPHEAALLASVLPLPLGWSAGSPNATVRHRAAVIEERVGQLGPLLDCVR